MTSKKVNVRDKTTMQELMGKSPPVNMELTDPEKITFGILLEKANNLQSDLQKVQGAIQAQVAVIVGARGLSTAKYGVNLAAGRILLIDLPVGQVTPQPGNDGQAPTS